MAKESGQNLRKHSITLAEVFVFMENGVRVDLGCQNREGNGENAFKKKDLALANPELHRLARKLLES